MSEEGYNRTKKQLNVIIGHADDTLTPAVAVELGESPEAWRGMFVGVQLFTEMIAQQLESLVELGDPLNTPHENEWNKWVQGVVGALFSLRNACIQMMPPERDG